MQGRRGCPDYRPPPPETAYLWRWFRDLEMARQGGQMGPQPLTYQEMEAWSRLARVRLTPWEADCLRSLDVVYLNDYAKDKAGDNAAPMTEDGEVDRDAVASGLKNAFASFKGEGIPQRRMRKKSSGG